MAAAAPGGDTDVDDYMGDLSAFLPPEEASSLQDQQQQRKKNTHKPAPRQRPDDWKKLTWQERRQHVREEKDKAEAAVLAEGLAAPIPPSNIGFKLLQKMGFKGPPEAERTGGKAEYRSAGRMVMAEIAEERHRGEGPREEEKSGVTVGGEKRGERGKAEFGGDEVTGEREKTLVTDAGSSRSLKTRVGEYCSDQRPAASTGEASFEDNLGDSGVPATTLNRKTPLAWVEPVALSLKRDRKGLGREEEEEQAERQKQLRAEAAARVRQRGEEALRGEFEERRKGRWSEWKVRGALRKARTALVHLEGGEEWLKAQAVRIGAASSSSPAASGSLMGGGAICGAGSGSERGAGAENGRDRRRRVRKKRIVTECDADGVSDEEWEEVEERRGDAREVEGGSGGGREKEGEGGEGGEAGQVPLEDIVSEELLMLALHHLRHKHFYCIHCGCQYESEEALASMCPGEDEEAH